METTFEFVPKVNPAITPASLPARDVREPPEYERLVAELDRMAALADLVARIESADSQRAACQTIVDQLQDFLSVDQAFVGLCREDSPACQLKAISNVGAFHPREERPQAAQAVLQEVIARGEPACWPAPNVSSRGGLLAHRQFAEANGAAALVSGPLRDASGKLRGAWMMVGPGETVLDERVSGFLRAAEPPVASALRLIARAERGRISKALRKTRRMLSEKRGQCCLAIAALVALMLFIPLRYRPKCDCAVEPVTRRYVAAPFAGPLEKALVAAGDEVKVGQLLARMDGREVRWELAGTRADLHRADKERAGYLATHDSGRAEVARFEVEQLRMRTELLEHRDQNLEIRSPIAGIVVSGDLEDAEGMPLEVGQTLFEIAPLAEMAVEVAVAEDDFAHVRAGMDVTVRLDAYPTHRFEATIKRIHPRANPHGTQNVFLAEVRLPNPDGTLRPGMRGSARIQGERHALGWILLRRPFAAAIAWLGW